MKATPWKTLREQDQEVRSAIYQRLGLPVEQKHENEVQATELWCRHCKSSFPVGSIRIGSAPRPHWYELLCPSQLPGDHYCEGSWEDFEHRKELRQ